MNFSKRLKKARESRGMTLLELANKIDRTEATVQRYESGNIKNLKNDTIEALAKALNVSPIYLMGWDEGKNLSPVVELLEIPILGKIACGDPITAIENIADYRTVPKNNIPSGGELFFLEAFGDSMEPKIPDGSYVLCRKQEDVESGEIAAVLVNNDEETTLKKVIKQNGTILLQPLNDKYAPYIVDKNNPARIVGKALKIEVDL